MNQLKNTALASLVALSSMGCPDSGPKGPSSIDDYEKSTQQAFENAVHLSENKCQARVDLIATLFKLRLSNQYSEEVNRFLVQAADAVEQDNEENFSNVIDSLSKISEVSGLADELDGMADKAFAF